jgi:hypothetical protein
MPYITSRVSSQIKKNVRTIDSHVFPDFRLQAITKLENSRISRSAD